MRLLVIASLLLIPLAGCISSGPVAEPSSETLDFEKPILLPGDVISAEPNIEADDDGRVWVIGVGAADVDANVATGQGNLWRSTDFGQSYEVLRLADHDGAADNVFCSCDTDVELGTDGRLYITDFWVAGALNGFNVEWSDDDGTTWSGFNPITIEKPAANDRQYITAGNDDGEIFLTYAGVNPASDLYVWRSSDGGQTFVPIGRPGDDATTNGGFIGKMRVDDSGDLWFPYMRRDAADPWNGPATAFVFRSTTDGLTWTEQELGVAPNGVGGLWPLAMDTGSDGSMHAVWMARVEGGGSHLWYTKYDGSSWSEPRVVGWNDGTAVLPWLAATDDGRAAIAFYGTPERVEPLQAEPPLAWHAWALIVDDNDYGEPVQVSPWPVKVGRFCPQGASCSEDRELLDYPGIDVAGGYVHVSFAVSTLDEGAGPDADYATPTGGHSTAAKLWMSRAELKPLS